MGVFNVGLSRRSLLAAPAFLLSQKAFGLGGLISGLAPPAAPSGAIGQWEFASFVPSPPKVSNLASPGNGDITFANPAPSVSNGYIDFQADAGSNVASTMFSGSSTYANFTFAALYSVAGSGANLSLSCFLADQSNPAKVLWGSDVVLMGSTNMFATGEPYLFQSHVNSVGRGWVRLITTYDGTTATIYANGLAIFSKVVSITPQAVSSLFFGTQINGTFYSGYRVGVVAIYNRALSGGEIGQLDRYLVGYANKAAISLPTKKRLIIWEGDSITKGGDQGDLGFAALASAASAAGTVATIFAVSGSGLSPDLIARGPTIDALAAKALNAGWEVCLHVLQGANGFTADQTAFGTYFDARRTANPGIKLVGATITSFHNDTLEPQRVNTANPQIRGFVGVHMDACSDFGGVTHLGGIGDYSNTTYFEDGIHPTAAGYALMSPVALAAINSVWAP